MGHGGTHGFAHRKILVSGTTFHRTPGSAAHRSAWRRCGYRVAGCHCRGDDRAREK